MIHSLESPRLSMRPLQRSDLAGVAVIFTDPEAMKFFSGAKTIKDVETWIDQNMEQYARRGFGQMAVLDKASGEFLGYCGLVVQEVRNDEVIELAYSFQRACWNQGYASEAALAVRDAAFGTADLRQIVSLVHPRNLASQRVAEKCGMIPSLAVHKWGKWLLVYQLASHLRSGVNL